MSAQVLPRRTFSVPRDSGYAKVDTLEKLAGRPKSDFAQVILKEALDNSLDACETVGVTPEITVSITPGADQETVLLVVEDNGPGISADTVTAFCDFTKSTSDKAAYVSPTRGAQGNAWPLIISMPHALGVRPGTVVIEALGTRHKITPDLVLGQRLTINSVSEPCERATGTRVIVPLPRSLELDVTRWVQDYATVNSHATFTVHTLAGYFCGNPETYKSTGQGRFRKRVPSQPTSAWWYDADRLRDLISSYLAAGDDKPVGTFVREFDGLKHTGKASRVISKLPGVCRLSDFRDQPETIRRLVVVMQTLTRKVQPAALGKIPSDHYKAMISGLFGISLGRFWHARKEVMSGGVPWGVDVVVAATERPGRVIYATNFGIAFDDPLANADLLPDVWSAATGAASFLRRAGAYPDETNNYRRAAIVHVQCAAPRWTDTGKVKLIVPDSVCREFAGAFAKATKQVRDER
ncbi:MAG TPA: ATP-binding protein [Streptosporangiaceae bacterium]|nr:ATP-binding protein [Streptosporangiaceae bacterium]